MSPSHPMTWRSGKTVTFVRGAGPCSPTLRGKRVRIVGQIDLSADTCCFSIPSRYGPNRYEYLCVSWAAIAGMKKHLTREGFLKPYRGKRFVKQQFRRARG